MPPISASHDRRNVRMIDSLPPVERRRGQDARLVRFVGAIRARWITDGVCQPAGGLWAVHASQPQAHDGPPVRVRARTASAAGGAQQDVDGVAVARAGGMAAQPVEVVGVALRRPRRGSSPRSDRSRAAGRRHRHRAARAARRGWRRRAGVGGGARRRSDSQTRRLTGSRTTDHAQLRSVMRRLGGLVERDAGVGMELAREHAVGRAS